MFKFRKKSHQEVLDNIPNHIGIIMDGNGRWAKGNHRSVTTWS